MADPLPIPDAAQRDPRSVEMVRAWIAENDLFVVLNVGFWEQPDRGIHEPEAWGLLMADMARHIANAHAEEYGRDVQQTLEEVRKAFEKEVSKPTSTHSGYFPHKGDVGTP